MDNIICKAIIKSSAKKLILIWILLFVSAFFILYHKDIYPIKTDNKDYYKERVSYQLAGKPIIMRYETFDCNNDYKMIDATNYTIGLGFYYAIILFFVSSIPLIYCLRTSKRCTLLLTQYGVNGKRKKLFSLADLKLPIDKIDSIMVNISLFNRLTDLQIKVKP